MFNNRYVQAFYIALVIGRIAICGDEWIFSIKVATNKFFTHKLCARIERLNVYYKCYYLSETFCVRYCLCTRLVRNNDLLMLLLKIKTIVFAGKCQV